MGDPAARPRAGAHISDGLDVDTGWHVHDLHQLLYAFEGSVEVESQAGRFLAPSQLALWIPAGVVHRTRIHQVRSGSVFFQPAMVAGAGARIRTIPVPSLMREMVMGAMRWPISEPQAPVGRAYFEALALLCGEWIRVEAPLALPTSRDPALERAMAFTRAHLADADLPGACRAAGLSERTLRRRFASQVGMTWDDYRRRCRLRRCLVLLGDGALSIGAIAAEVGFESPSALAKAFRASMGEGPRDYRRRVQLATRSAPAGPAAGRADRRA
jgi:AraC-like DNA-binding protein